MSFDPILSTKKDKSRLGSMFINPYKKKKIEQKMAKRGLKANLFMKTNNNLDGYTYCVCGIDLRAEQIAKFFARMFPHVTFAAYVHYSNPADSGDSIGFDFLFNKRCIHEIDIGEYDYIKQKERCSVDLAGVCLVMEK